MVPPPAEFEERLDELICEYFSRRERTELESARDWIARHPEFADPLTRFFEAELDVERVTSPLRSLVQLPLDVMHDRTLGDYRLVRELGRGGMGVVYEAEQLSLGRRVAVKVLPFAGMLDERQLRRFRNEAQAAAMLKHPHIVSVHAIGCERGTHFYAMELVEGQSLAELATARNEAQGTPSKVCPSSEDNARRALGLDSSLHPPVSGLPPDTIRGSLATTARDTDHYRTVARLGVQAAEALDYAHHEGVIHRDIKPSNLLVDCDSKLWVTDFGLARIATNDQLTCTGDVLGTLRYMSPEQLAGGKVVDQRTDIYSLGLTLYELLAKRPAFAAADREKLLQAVLTDEPTPLRKLDSGIPHDLETIVLKATTKDREARYQTAGELADDLQRFLESRPIRARRASRVRRLRYWARRNPYLAATTAALFAALTILGVAGPYAAIRQARISNTLAVQVYIQDVQLAYVAWEEGDVERVKTLLERHIPADGEYDLRGFEWHHLYGKYRASDENVTAQFSGNAGGIGFSPCGYFAVGSGDRAEAHIKNTFTGEVLARLPGKDVFRPVLSPDGRRLAVGEYEGSIRVWDVKSRKLEQTLNADSQTPECMAFSPDGSRLIVGERGNHVFFWDVDRGTLLAACEHIGWIRAVAFSPDGRLAASAGDVGNQVKIWDAHARTELFALEGQRAAIYAVAFSPDGNTLATGGDDELIQVFDVHTGQRLRTFSGPSGSYCRSLAFSPDGSVLAAGGPDRTVRYWYVATGREGEPLRGHTNEVLHVTFVKDVLVSAARDFTVRAWHGPWIGSAGEVRERTFSMTPLAYSQFGPTLAIGRGAISPKAGIGRLALRNLANGEQRELFTDGPSVMSLACSPDGELLAAGLGRFGREGEPHFGEVRIWRVSSGKLMRATRAHEHPIYSVRFSPDGRFLASASVKLAMLGEIKIWDITTGKLVQTLQDDNFGPWSVDFSPDGELLAVGGGRWRDGRVRLWDWRRNALVAEHDAHSDGQVSVCYSPNGQLFASGCWDNVVKLWDADGCTERSAFRGHRHSVAGICFSPDGSRLASAASDRIIKLWHIDTGSELAVFRAHSGLTSVLFFPGGQTLAAGCTDHSVMLWHADGRTEVLPAE